MAKPIIFISYSRADIEFVRRLAADLTRAGYSPWWDVEDLRGGQRWAAEIEKWVRACSAMVVVLSPESKRSEWVHKETLKALELKKPIVPVMWRESELPISLVDYQFVNFRRNYDEGLQTLLQSLSRRTVLMPTAARAPAGAGVYRTRAAPQQRPQGNTNMLLGVVGALAAIIVLFVLSQTCSGPEPVPKVTTQAPTTLGAASPRPSTLPPTSLIYAPGTATERARQTQVAAAATEQAIRDATATAAAKPQQVVAQGTVHLVSEESFDFLTGARTPIGTLTGGDLYVLLRSGGGCNDAESFWANNIPQRGGVDLGPPTQRNLAGVQVPTSESYYSRHCVPIVENHIYAYLSNHAGLVAIFHVKSHQPGAGVDLEYVVVPITLQ